VECVCVVGVLWVLLYLPLIGWPFVVCVAQSCLRLLAALSAHAGPEARSLLCNDPHFDVVKVGAFNVLLLPLCCARP
jgi:hypothetical protein